MAAGRTRLDLALLALAFVGFVATVDGGPGWAGTSTRVVLAVRADHAASAPLYDGLATAATLLPFGEPGFRLGILGALLATFALAGVVAAARALLPKEPTAGYVAALLVGLAPPTREALATPQILAACGAVWAIACAARHARSKSARDAACALAAAIVVAGAAPWLGAILVAVIGGWLVRDRAAPQLVALGGVAFGLVVIALWWNALGALPGLHASLADALGASGRGAASVVVGAGLLGIAFGALTALPSSRWLAVTAATVVAHEILVGGTSIALLATFAIGIAIVAAALARVLSTTPGSSDARPDMSDARPDMSDARPDTSGARPDTSGARSDTSGARPDTSGARPDTSGARPDTSGSRSDTSAPSDTSGSRSDTSARPDTSGWLASIRRDAIVVACGVPFVIAAIATGVRADLPGDTPTRLASDLVDALPPGPGLFVATRPASWFALQHERAVAGARLDLVLVPPLPGERADVLVADALRAHQVVGADAASFGRLDVQRAVPSGRGFQLVGAVPEHAAPVEAPAHYATAIGSEQAIMLALERARIEAASGRLDMAARAAGLTERFRAADLAVLAATVPTSKRPALYGFLPSAAPGPWLLDVFGDDLAWVAGLAIPPIPADAPMPRRLHELWRQILAGTAKPDAAIAFGPEAVDATTTMLKELGR